MNQDKLWDMVDWFLLTFAKVVFYFILFSAAVWLFSGGN